MRFVTLREALALQRLILQSRGGAPGVRDLGGLESALAQPLHNKILFLAPSPQIPQLRREFVS